MGYCPRCGENPAYETGVQRKSRDLRPRPLRIDAGSRIVSIPPDTVNGTVLRIGGTRFRVDRADGAFLLHLAD